ncbi:glycine cleavage system aminomethyltransferase GcvT [Oricola sp.]|uniref:glycine cleavage system aminomethyltransferase GcvT n=1 Tax=Oricola sp. TaxID=1979950 RepID=UPI0026000832|nr:glycine cleavage system aminomethyltransferase GcvT [Oricola sp.]MCI5075988.1 glycine cleavage system aminomethyltransferase GcvT [Oricola sp.]
MTESESLKQLPLQALHERAGAKFAPFAGWSMPVSYPLGVLKEHLHTREHAGLFDISHMRLIEVAGPDAADLVARLCPVEVASQSLGACKYTFLLNDNAGIIDDLIVTRLADDRFMIVANAGRAETDEAWIRTVAAEHDVSIEALDRVFLALQGPYAAAVMAETGFDVSDMRFMSGGEPRPGWFMTRSGYTGEDGFEIAMPLDRAETFAETLAADERVSWIGLAARDSLRLEAGLCLYGNDLDETTDPVSAGLTWAIPKTLRAGGSYVGASRLAEIFASGPDEKRVGLQAEGRQPVRAGAPLTVSDGKPAGRVTSGGFGPSVEHPVAMGYVRADLAQTGTVLSADVRGRPIAMHVTKLPFITKRSQKG